MKKPGIKIWVGNDLTLINKVVKELKSLGLEGGNYDNIDDPIWFIYAFGTSSTQRLSFYTNSDERHAFRVYNDVDFREYKLKNLNCKCNTLIQKIHLDWCPAKEGINE